MNPYQSYQQETSLGLSRVDLILATYDRVLERLERARELLPHQPDEAARLAREGEFAMLSLANGVNGAGELEALFVRLYEFVAHCLHVPDRLGDAIDVLTMLREAFEAVRSQATELERSGQIPSLDSTRLVQTTA